MTRRLTTLACILALCFLCFVPLCAEQRIDSIQQDMEELSRRMAKIERELFGAEHRASCEELNSTVCKYVGQEFWVCTWDENTQRCHCIAWTC